MIAMMLEMLITIMVAMMLEVSVAMMAVMMVEVMVAVMMLVELLKKEESSPLQRQTIQRNFISFVWLAAAKAVNSLSFN